MQHLTKKLSVDWKPDILGNKLQQGKLFAVGCWHIDLIPNHHTLFFHMMCDVASIYAVTNLVASGV